MKPIRLEMQAFGPYDEKTVIEFEEMDHGLFLVTGETGSGKTMIFDAMSYALYGETTGSRRGADSLKSDFTDKKPYVLLDFVHDGISYSVYREPSYTYTTRNGTVSKKSASSELYMGDECLCTKNKDVTEAITDILGIGPEQWGQISMIAQGEFVKLLDSNSAERSEILGRLFKTGRFTFLIEELKRRSKDKDEEYSDSENALNWIARSAFWDPEDDVSSMTFEEMAAKLESYNRRDEAQLKSLEESHVELEKAYATALQKDGEAEALAKDFSKLDEENEKWKSLQEQKEQIERKRTDLDLASRSVAIDAVRRDRESHRMAALEASKRLEAFEQRKKDNDAALEGLRPEYEALPGRREELKNLGTRLDDFNKKLEACCNATNIRSDLDGCRKELEELESASNTQQAERKELEESRKEIASTLEALAESAAEADVCRVRLDGIRKDLGSLEKDSRTLENIKSRCAEIESVKEELARKSSEFTNLDIRRADMSHRFLLSQAGIIAKSLIPGAPCPVCGSTDHPSPATVPEDVPTEESIKGMESQVEIARKKRDDVNGKLTRIAGERNSMIESLSGYGDSIEAIETVIADRLASLNREASELESELESRMADKKRLEDARAQDNKASTRLEELKKSLESLGGRISDAKAKEATLAERLRAAIDACEGAEKNAINADIAATKENSEKLSALIDDVDNRMKEATNREASLKSSIESEEANVRREKETFEAKSEEVVAMLASVGISETDLDGILLIDSGALKSEIDRYDGAVRTNNALLEDLRTRVDGKEKPDAEAARKEVVDTKAAVDESVENRTALSNRLSHNTDVAVKMRERIPRWEKLRGEAEELRLLADAASGKVQGGAKVPFDQYIQTVFFDSILLLANKRLTNMSGGRYELIRKKEGDRRSQTALDIDVMDNYTGIQRSVKTLSGGESFKAALSLALGLSDMVQYTAGGLRVETLFIDEGFGSLDSESLEQAITVLESLSEGDVMVGVISHVDLFKERLSKKICVTKKKNGGSRVEIITD